MTKTVTETLAEWVVSTRFEDVPEIGVARVRERFIDTIGVACAGMSVSTGRIMAEWVRQQGAQGDGDGHGGAPGLRAMSNGA